LELSAQPLCCLEEELLVVRYQVVFTALAVELQDKPVSDLVNNLLWSSLQSLRLSSPVWNAAQRATCAVQQSRSGGQQPSMQTSSVSPSCDSERHKRISAFFSKGSGRVAYKGYILSGTSWGSYRARIKNRRRQSRGDVRYARDCRRGFSIAVTAQPPAGPPFSACASPAVPTPQCSRFPGI
jgi:hypothetical protein